MNRVKLIFLPVLLIIMSTQFSRANLLLVDETVNVIRENTGGGPRIPPAGGYPTFNIELVGNVLMFDVNNINGNIKIEIIGDQQLVFQRTAVGTFSENFDFNTLTAGYVYTLRITTSVGVYIGEFEL
ncbi:MAG: hypothetical protein QMB37_11820 [Paludibacteraceae bacterium]